MVKKAPLHFVKAGTVHPGKYLVLVGGQVAPVEESYREGLNVGQNLIVDHLILPDIHPAVAAAILGVKQPNSAESLGVMETTTVASNIKAADAAVKGADVLVLEIRLADDLGGKAFTFLGGNLENIQAAIDIGSKVINTTEVTLYTSIVPRIDGTLMIEIDKNSRFYGQNPWIDRK